MIPKCDSFKQQEFLTARSPRAAHLGGSDSHSLMKLLSSCRPRAAVILELLWGQRSHFKAPSHGCWREASIPLQMGLSMNMCPNSMAAGFPQAIQKTDPQEPQYIL